MSLKSPKKVPVPKKAPSATGVTLDIPPGQLQIGQEQTGWCWAACVQLVLSYHKQQVKQCDLANDVKRLGGQCCADPLPDACNDGLYVPEVNNLYYKFGIQCNVVNAALSAQAVKDQLGTYQPVGVGLSWGHMLLLYGWTGGPSGDVFRVYDPADPGGDGTLPYAEIVNYGYIPKGWDTSWKVT